MDYSFCEKSTEWPPPWLSPDRTAWLAAHGPRPVARLPFQGRAPGWGGGLGRAGGGAAAGSFFSAPPTSAASAREAGELLVAVLWLEADAAVPARTPPPESEAT